MSRRGSAEPRDLARAGAFTAAFLFALVGSLHLLLSISGRPEDPAAAERHLSRGEAFERAGRTGGAVSEYERALEIARDSEADLLVARAANRFAALSQRLGDAAGALELATEALEASERSGDPAGQSEALFNLGSARYSMGRVRAALGSFERSAEVASGHGLRSAEARALLQAGLTATLLERGEAAAAWLERSAGLARELGDDSGEAAAIRALGQLYARVGDSQKALDRFAQARKLLRPLNDVEGEATLLNAIGQVYFDLGMTESALASFEEALRLNRRLRYRRREAASLFEIGRCHLALGRLEPASRSFGEALRIYRALDNPRLQADVLSELARIAERAGDYRAAFRQLDEAIALKRAAGDVRYQAYALNEAARLHVDRGRLERAGRHVGQALELSRAARDPWGESLALYNVARIRRGEGRLQEAVAAIERSLSIVEDLRTRVASHALRASFLSAVHERYFLLTELLAELHERRPRAGYDGLAFEASERARARTLLDSLEEAAAGIRADLEPELLAEERALRARLDELSQEQLLLPVDGEEAEEIGRELDRLAAEYDRLQARMRSSSPRYAALTRPQTVSLEDVQSRLLGDEATRLLAYSLGPHRSFLWSVSRDRRALFELPPGPEVEALASRVHAGLASGRRQASLDADLAELADVLLGPVPGLEAASRLVLVTEGALNYVPFGVLPLPSGEPLVTRTEVVRLPSVSVLPLLRQQHRKPPHPKWALVVADPVYGEEAPPARARLRLGRLAWSGREAEAIRAVAPPGRVDLLTGADARLERLAEADLHAYRILHFAAHGVVDTRRPELSGIALSTPPSAGPGAGFLRLHDIYDLDLSAELVVLSACETALGADVRGEGIVGLVRGFMYAGARSVVASAWRVDDEATAELMKRFYRELSAGRSKSRALRVAQNAVRAEPRWEAPYYWGAFELQGDWR